MQSRNNNNILGMDVSHYNGNINWQKAKADGIEFVFIKATEGTVFIDDKLIQNYNGAKAVGIKVGFYHFARLKDDADAIQEAQFFINTVKNLENDYAHVLDIETNDNKLDRNTISRLSSLWLNTVQKATGSRVMIYSGSYFVKDNFTSDMKKYPLWIANYNVTTPMENGIYDHWDVFQYSEYGSINGVGSSSVDLDVMDISFLKEITAKIISGDDTNMKIKLADWALAKAKSIVDKNVAKGNFKDKDTWNKRISDNNWDVSELFELLIADADGRGGN